MSLVEVGDGGRSLETAIRASGGGCVVGTRARGNARRGGRNVVKASECARRGVLGFGPDFRLGMGETSCRRVHPRIGLGIGSTAAGFSGPLLGTPPADALRTVPPLHGPTTLKHSQTTHHPTTIDDTTPPRPVDRRFHARRFPTGKSPRRHVP